MKPPKTKTEFDKLKASTHKQIMDSGMKIFNKSKTHIHYLYPATWYNNIPNGYPVTDIGGQTEKFKKGVSDDDQRFGALPYGFVKKIK